MPPSRVESAAEAAARRRPVNRHDPASAGEAEPRLQPRTLAALLVLLLALLLWSRFAPAQAVGQGFELERAGQYQRAATVYFTTLRGDSTNLAALLGLERVRSEEHTSELQSLAYLVCRLLLEKKKHKRTEISVRDCISRLEPRHRHV